jgi:hypothetical protein
MWIICRGRQRLAQVGKLQLPKFAALPPMQKFGRVVRFSRGCRRSRRIQRGRDTTDRPVFYIQLQSSCEDDESGHGWQR